MKIYKIAIIVISLVTLVSGCGTPDYQKASLGLIGGTTGYLDKEVAPGVYLIEYSHIGGYNHDIELMKQYWLRRANEICPNGFIGDYEVIFPYQARFKEFRNDRNYAQQYPLVSGFIQCKK